jgi:hypothetical protein
VRVAFSTHLTKLIEGKGAGEALTRLLPASRRERGRMRLESFMVIMRARVKSRNRTKVQFLKVPAAQTAYIPDQSQSLLDPFNIELTGSPPTIGLARPLLIELYLPGRLDSPFLRFHSLACFNFLPSHIGSIARLQYGER